MASTQSQPTMCACSTVMASMLQQPAVEMEGGQATMSMDFGAIRIQLEPVVQRSDFLCQLNGALIIQVQHLFPFIIKKN